MRKMIGLFMAAVLPLTALAGAVQNPALIDVQTGKARPAPAVLTPDSYLAWAAPLMQGKDGIDYTSAFTPMVFSWYQREKDRALPPQVNQDPQHVFVNVQRPLQETIALEEAGEIEEGNTVGAEVYADMPGTPDQALEAMLFRWGKPVGTMEGYTYPQDGNFGRRIDYFAPNPEWGTQAYASLSLRRDGGVVHDLADRYMVLIRGDGQHGYDVFMQYIGPGGDTESKQCFAIAMIRPNGAGHVSYKLSTRFQGQSYKVLGNVSIGRSQVGFNVDKVRAIQLDFMEAIKDLQVSGKIKDRPSDIHWEK